jgi:hypothetical protein
MKFLFIIHSVDIGRYIEEIEATDVLEAWKIVSPLAAKFVSDQYDCTVCSYDNILAELLDEYVWQFKDLKTEVWISCILLDNFDHEIEVLAIHIPEVIANQKVPEIHLKIPKW